ncbi:hypothetical protein PTKIN_Ptkin06aG0161900 [Pterospermum kingtungense]
MGNAQGLQKLVSLMITSCWGVTDAQTWSRCSLADVALSLMMDWWLLLSLQLLCPLLAIPLNPCQELPRIWDSQPGYGGQIVPSASGLYGITDAGLLPLLESCEAGLVKVNLSGCLNLTDEVVSALTRLHGETLEVLNLDGCRRITDASLVAVADNCVFLSDLDVSKCAITYSGVAALSLVEQLNLQVLSVSDCSGVSNKSMPSLKKLGKTLVGLNLQHCNSNS